MMPRSCGTSQRRMLQRASLRAQHHILQDSRCVPRRWTGRIGSSSRAVWQTRPGCMSLTPPVAILPIVTCHSRYISSLVIHGHSPGPNRHSDYDEVSAVIHHGESGART
ncbi:hypothetical protein OH77DRAFT_259885 [Trametes cingulata]|nr:hypothetical protein OH77DRAFT_259885 [Trametes cingulata]